MISKQEVLENYKEYKTFLDDRFGKRFASFCYADELEKIGFSLNCSDEEWNKDVKEYTRENIIKVDIARAAKDFILFLFIKVPHFSFY